MERIVTCQRCGKTLRIVNEEDCIHTCTPKESEKENEEVDKSREKGNTTMKQ